MTSRADIDDALWSAALHEAGHLVALRALGGIGHARVWANAARRPGDEAWLGRTLTLVAPTCDGWERIVALAGPVAERFERCGDDATAIEHELRTLQSSHAISITDAAMMGADWETTDLRRTVDLLLARRSEMLWEANWMAVDGRAAA